MKSEPRRSMSVALQTTDLPAEALSLIKAGTPRPRSLSRAIDPPAEKTAVAELPAPSQTRQTEPPSGQDQNANFARPAVVAFANELPVTPRLPEKPADVSKPTSATSASSVAITVRVPSGLPNRLLRATTDRKINQQSPFTQQEIVAQALEQWLQTHGY